jgi:hypothetical protein
MVSCCFDPPDAVKRRVAEAHEKSIQSDHELLSIHLVRVSTLSSDNCTSLLVCKEHTLCLTHVKCVQ